MAVGLYQRVIEIARERGIDDSHLRELMFDRDLTYHPMYVDSLASPDDIHTIAEILQVPSSRLFEATTYIGDLIKALFEEKWPQYENRVSISKEDAFNRVMESEYRWNSSDSPIRNQVELVLKALESPSERRDSCQYPDCEYCTGRCRVTGYMIGPEG